MLILEDDAVICDHIKDILKNLQCTDKYNYISLEVRTRPKFISKTNIKSAERYCLHDLIYDKGGAAGYILWPDGANRLIQHIETHGLAPADALIAECKNITAGQIRPGAILQLDVCPLHELPQICNPISVIRSMQLQNESKSSVLKTKYTPVPKAISKNNYLLCKKNRIIAQLKIALNTYLRSIFSSDIEEVNIKIEPEDFKKYRSISPPA